ncbi:MAG TPA: NB-ARC domain-containing protein [Coleofasciculaceae cyanobacterium]|jgi:WD40 repeat protein
MTLEEALATLKAILGKKPLNELQEIVFRQCWEKKSYPEIAESSGYDDGYVKYVGFELWKMLSVALGERVTKNNFRSALSRWRSRSGHSGRSLQDNSGSEQGSRQAGEQDKHTEVSDGISVSTTTAEYNVVSGCRQDWGEAIDVSVFYGRSTELVMLERWIVQENCRLVALLGIGGIGKTALSVKLAEQLQGDFEYVIWRSLHNAPSLESLLASSIEFLSNQQEIDLPDDVNSRISRLLNYLKKHRCLIVLDNAETIVCSSTTQETCEGYEGYSELFKRIGESRHQSCLVLTSREKPKEVAALEGETFPVRSLPLSGLATTEGREIFGGKGNFSGSENDWKNLIQSYGGNPLALKIVATTIRDLFDSNISNFLSQGTVIFGDIQNLLTQQFCRLSHLETEIMYWLAINREPVTITELKADLVSPILPSGLLEAIESLERKSLIEKGTARFTLQPVLMEYVTNRLVKEVCQEIETREISLFKNYALLKAQAKDFIKDMQSHFILKPISEQLLRVFGTPENFENQLMKIISSLRGKLPIETGYVAGNTINLLLHLNRDLSEASGNTKCTRDFSALTVWQADLKGVNLHCCNFSGSDLAKSTFTENLGYVFAMAVSPDGKLLATADSHAKIRLWRVTDGQQLLSWDGQCPGWTRALAFSPDGKTLISGSDDKAVKLWDVSTGQCRQTLYGHGHTGWILYVAYSPQGESVASCSEDATVKLWDVSTGQCRQTFQGHTSWVSYVAFSPDGQMLASCSVDKTIKLWDINTGQCLKTLQGHEDVVGFVMFSADYQALISASEDQTIKVWDVQTGQCKRTLPGGHKGWVWWSAVALSCDNKTLAIGSTDQTVKLWDITTGQVLRTLQHSSGVRTIVFSPDGETLIGSHEDQTLKLWNVSDGRCLKTFQGYSSGVWSIAFSPDGQTLASGGADQMVKVWNVLNGRCLSSFRGHTDMVRFVAYNPQGNTLASGGADRTVKLWNISDGRCLQTFKGHTNWVMSVKFSPDGHSLASASLDQTVRLWDINTGECLRILQAHETLALSVTYSPDGQILASSGADHRVKLWDIKTGQCIKVLQGHTNWVFSVAFSPDGQTLASGSVDRTIRVWDVRNGQCLGILQGHESWVNSVAYSLDGQLLASSGLDGMVRLWDVHNGRCLRVLQEHTRWVLSVAFTTGERFSPNLDQVLASSSDDQTIRFWDIKTGECLKILQSERPYEGMNITGVVGITEAQKSTLKALGAIELAS